MNIHCNNHNQLYLINIKRIYSELHNLKKSKSLDTLFLLYDC